MSKDDALRHAIACQESAEIGAFKLWCTKRGLDFTSPDAQARFWDERADRIATKENPPS